MTRVKSSCRRWSKGRLYSISNMREFTGLFGGVEEKEGSFEEFIMAMTRMTWKRRWWEEVLDSILRTMLSFPFTCLKMKEYCENHYDHLNSCAFGMNFFFKFSMWENVAIFYFTVKWCPIKWNSNFEMPYFTASISLKVEW